MMGLSLVMYDFENPQAHLESFNVDLQYYPHSAPLSSGAGRSGSRMAPPQSDLPPQPVEIDLNNLRALPSPYFPLGWDPSLFQPGNLGELPSPYVSAVTKKSHPLEGEGRPNQDPIASWYTENDGPWIPKDSLSTAAIDDRAGNRPITERASVSFGAQYRPTNLSDNEAIQYGVPPSDSGYGTRRSVGTASVLASDSLDKDQDSQSMASHGGEYLSFQGIDVLPQIESQIAESWASIARVGPQNVRGMLCPFSDCKKQLKTRSELK